jgi:hypothetical protein
LHSEAVKEENEASEVRLENGFSSSHKFFNHLLLLSSFSTDYLWNFFRTCALSSKSGKQRKKYNNTEFFEDFSYGKQSLDGLLFPQRAFFIAPH